jgi:hypothetical protein
MTRYFRGIAFVSLVLQALAISCDDSSSSSGGSNADDREAFCRQFGAGTQSASTKVAAT